MYPFSLCWYQTKSTLGTPGDSTGRNISPASLTLSQFTQIPSPDSKYGPLTLLILLWYKGIYPTTFFPSMREHPAGGSSAATFGQSFSGAPALAVLGKGLASSQEGTPKVPISDHLHRSTEPLPP